MPTLDKRIMWMFRINAVINIGISIRGILDPSGTAVAFGGHAPNYPFMVRLWMGLVFLFGLMFWETSRDVRRNAVLIKYNWIEKSITATAITIGFLAGEVPVKLMVLIILTNVLWIPVLLHADLGLRRAMRPMASTTEGSAMATSPGNI